MTRNALLQGITLLLILSSCTSQATPTVEPTDIQHTAEAMALTMVAQTQAAIPSATKPPTETPHPTDTPLPSPTLGTIEALPTLPATFTPQSSTSGQDPCNKTLTAWEGLSANFDIVYEYSPQGKDDKVVFSLWVSTNLGECGFLADVSTGPEGNYTAAAFVDGKNDFKVFGGFPIREGNWTLIVRNQSIVAQGGCYPHC